MDPGHFSALYNFKTEIGLDIAVQIHRAFGESLNALCDSDPPARFYPPGYSPGHFSGQRAHSVAAEPEPPYSASPATAQAGKRRRGRGGSSRR